MVYTVTYIQSRWYLWWHTRMMTSITYCTRSHTQGGHKVGEKFLEFSRLLQSHNYTFPEVITTKTIGNNDLHISRVIPHQLLLMSLTRARHPILLKSAVFVHQIHLAACRLLDTGCSQSAKSVFPEVAQNSLRIPWVFHVQRNPWVFQICKVCGYPDTGWHKKNELLAIMC